MADFKHKSKNKIEITFTDGEKVFSPGECSSKRYVTIENELQWVLRSIYKEISESDHTESEVSKIKIKMKFKNEIL